LRNLSSLEITKKGPDIVLPLTSLAGTRNLLRKNRRKRKKKQGEGFDRYKGNRGPGRNRREYMKIAESPECFHGKLT
jgi:hypothetical protein